MMRAAIAIAVAVCASAAADINDGLIAHWKLDGNAQDASGNGHAGSVIASSPTPCDDRFGNPTGAVCFDGDDAYRVPASGLHPPTFTIAAWVRTTADGWSTVITSDPNSAACHHGFTLDIRFTKVHANADPAPSCGNSNVQSSAKNVADGVWHHIAVIYDGDLAVFVDGVKDSPTSSDAYPPTNAPLTIGTTITDSGFHRYFVGSIDDVRYYNRPLSSAEMLQLAREGEPCPADWNLDDIVNTQDFVAFLNDYTAVQGGGDPQYGNPDLAEPFDVLNSADFVAFLNLWSNTCP